VEPSRFHVGVRHSLLSVHRRVAPAYFCRVVDSGTLTVGRSLAKGEEVFTHIRVGSLTSTRTNFLPGASD
jgi:hypothetical protein